MAATNYAGGAQATTTLASMNTTVTSIQVAATTGWPSNSNPFVIKFDPGLATEEKCLISTYDGSGNLTIATRAYDGTTAYSHVQGATVQPCWDAVSAQDNNNHIYDPTRNDHTQYLTPHRPRQWHQLPQPVICPRPSVLPSVLLGHPPTSGPPAPRLAPRRHPLVLTTSISGSRCRAVPENFPYSTGHSSRGCSVVNARVCHPRRHQRGHLSCHSRCCEVCG
jgi:hypothetical protein